MTFRDLLGSLTRQEVLINTNGFEGRYAVGLFVAVEHDYLSIQLAREAAHYPLSRVLEVTTANDGLCYVAVARNSRVELQPEAEGNELTALVLITSSEAS